MFEDVPAIRVLVLDDDLAALSAIDRALKQAGHQVTQVRSADDAINAMHGGRRFDVILSDVWMPTPGGDGMAFYAQLLELSPEQAERIVFITGGGLPDRLSKFLQGKRVIAKPFRTADLIAAIEEVARSGGANAKP